MYLGDKIINIQVFQKNIKELLTKPQNLVFFPLLVIFVFYFQSILSLYELWMQPGTSAYSHGVLAFLLSLYIFSKHWFSRTTNYIYIANLLGLIFLVIAVLLWFLAYIGNIQIVQQISLIGITGFIFWYLFGNSIFSVLIVPILIVITAIPIWGFSSYYLQHVTVSGVSSLLRLTTIPFLNEGFYILLPSGTFEVADVCSGLHMVTAIVPVALFYLYKYNLRWEIGVVYVVVATLVAILANIVRIFIVVVAGHLTEMKHYFVTTDHIMLGWVVFGAAVFVFIFVSNTLLLSNSAYPKFSRKIRLLDQTKDSSVISKNDNNTKVKIIGCLISGCLIVGAGPIVAQFIDNMYSEIPKYSIKTNSSYGEWHRINNAKTKWKPVYHGFDDDNLSIYEKSTGENIQMYLAHYSVQTQGKEAVYYKNLPYQEAVWEKVSKDNYLVKLDGLGVFNVEEFEIELKGDKRKIVWRWNYISGNRVSNAFNTKILEIVNKLKGKPSITVFVLATDLNNSHEVIRDRLKGFLSNSLPILEGSLNDV